MLVFNNYLVMHKTIWLSAFLFFYLTGFCFSFVKFLIHYSAHPFPSVTAKALADGLKVFFILFFIFFTNLETVGPNGYSSYIHLPL